MSDDLIDQRVRVVAAIDMISRIWDQFAEDERRPARVESMSGQLRAFATIGFKSAEPLTDDLADQARRWFGHVAAGANELRALANQSGDLTHGIDTTSRAVDALTDLSPDLTAMWRLERYNDTSPPLEGDM